MTAATTTAATVIERCQRLHGNRLRSAGPPGISIACSHRTMSPVGLGTESATPVWAGPQLPGRIPSSPASPGAA